MLRRKRKHKKKKKRNNTLEIFGRIMQEFQKLFYYGCDVDSWLPEVMLYPFVSLPWKNVPTWYRIIAPPSCGKTAHLLLISDFYLSYTISEFTPKSFVSGFRGGSGDVSTLPQLNGKVLVILDESVMIDQRQEDRNQVQSILRHAYDGTFSKSFGNIKEKVEHKAYFNILAAATPQIDRHFAYNQALGERYINFRLQIPNRIQLTRRAYDNQLSHYKKKHKRLKDKVWNFLRNLPEVQLSDIKIDDNARDIFIMCADFIAQVRTHVPRDASGRHITILPQPEAAGRLVQQMVQVAASGAIIRGSKRVKQDQLSKAIYIALCSMPAVIAFMLYSIWKHTITTETKWFSVQKMVLYTAIGRSSVIRLLEDLGVHRVLELRKQNNLRGYEYSMSDYSMKVIKDTNLFEYYIPPVINKKTKKKKIKRKKVLS